MVDLPGMPSTLVHAYASDGLKKGAMQVAAGVGHILFLVKPDENTRALPVFEPAVLEEESKSAEAIIDDAAGRLGSAVPLWLNSICLTEHSCAQPCCVPEQEAGLDWHRGVQSFRILLSAGCAPDRYPALTSPTYANFDHAGKGTGAKGKGKHSCNLFKVAGLLFDIASEQLPVKLLR